MATIPRPENQAEPPQPPSYGQARVIENDRSALCGAITLIVIGIIPMNALALLMGIFALVALGASFEAWKTWKRVVEGFYYINFVICAAGLVGGIIMIIVGAVMWRGDFVGAGIGMTIMSVVVWFFAQKTYKAISELYGSIREEVKDDKVYGNTTLDTTTNTRV